MIDRHAAKRVYADAVDEARRKFDATMSDGGGSDKALGDAAARVYREDLNKAWRTYNDAVESHASAPQGAPEPSLKEVVP